MATATAKISEEKATITLPPAVGKILKTGGEAVIDIGEFTIRIAPKSKLSRQEIQKRQREDACLWQKIERGYRAVRSELTRARYPYLYD